MVHSVLKIGTEYPGWILICLTGKVNTLRSKKSFPTGLSVILNQYFYFWKIHSLWRSYIRAGDSLELLSYELSNTMFSWSDTTENVIVNVWRTRKSFFKNHQPQGLYWSVTWTARKWFFNFYIVFLYNIIFTSKFILFFFSILNEILHEVVISVRLAKYYYIYLHIFWR